MTDKEAAFYRSAVTASGGKDGNFEFSCPHCGGYSIGVLKQQFGLILASCITCSIYVREPVFMEKGA